MIHARRGFTLIELLITAIVMAILGTILARMLVQDSRFVERVEAQMSARQTARAAITLMSTELSMAGRTGLVSATATKLTFHMPVAWGMACQRSGGNVIASLLPTDSMTLASNLTEGLMWIDSTGTPQYFYGTTTLISGPRAECTADSIRALPGGQHIEWNPFVALGPGEVPSGSIVYTFDEITYEFRPSAANAGRIGLWRDTEASGTVEELLSPFDSTSRFEFVTDANGAPSLTPPGVLSTLYAIELIIIGESVKTPRDANTPEEFQLRTRVTFVN